MSGIVVKPRARIFHGHDWVYAADVQKVFGQPEPGSVISLKDFRDRPLGSAIYNPQSQIVARRFSRHRETLDRPLFVRRLTRAWTRRQRLPGVNPNLCRVVWSESDGLPGVVIDRYGPHFVLQTLTLAMDQRKALLAQMRAPRAKRFVQEKFTDRVTVAGDDRPWSFKLEATVALPGGTGGEQTSTRTLLFTERVGGAQQLAGSKEFDAVFEIEQPLLDALWTFTYGPRDPGPAPEPKK